MKAVGTRVRIPETDGVCWYLWGAMGTITGHRFSTIDDREVNEVELDEIRSPAPGWGLKNIGLPDHQIEEVES